MDSPAAAFPRERWGRGPAPGSDGALAYSYRSESSWRIWPRADTNLDVGCRRNDLPTMDGEDSVDVDLDVDPRELQETLQTYRKLADDFANHDTILKVKKRAFS